MSSTRAPGPSSSGCSPAELSGEALSEVIWNAKYRGAGEQTVQDSWRRIARAVAAVEREPQVWEGRFREILEGFRFLPGGRIQAGAGRPGAVLFNCFVLPGPDADPVQSVGALAAAVATLRAGGGIGCDFSGVPPAGWPTADGAGSPGPVGYLELWDTACRVSLAHASRKGAMMGALACEHPDLSAFVRAKRSSGALARFNLSVAVNDRFMEAVRRDAPWEFRFPPDGPVVRAAPARAAWDEILRAAYDTGDPGVLFIDRINASDNLGWRERIAVTNPCGEVPLPDFGACDLGSLNLTAFVRDPFAPRARLDLKALAMAAGVAVRFLDNVIDISAFPLPEQAQAARLSRRIGLGVTGLADALLMLGHRYGDAASLRVARRAMAAIRNAAYRASIALAGEKGSFPAFNRERILDAEFIRRLPADIREGIMAYGLHNSHLLAIAPTGSISLLAGGISSGLEPIFATVQARRIGLDGAVALSLDPGVALWRQMRRRRTGAPSDLVAARDLRIDAHLQMQAALQPYVDNAISKTVNVPADLPFARFRRIYERAYELGLKGCTAFRARPDSVLEAAGCQALPEDVDRWR